MSYTSHKIKKQTKQNQHRNQTTEFKLKSKSITLQTKYIPEPIHRKKKKKKKKLHNLKSKKMKFFATTLTVISYLAISNAEDSPSVNLRGSVSESSDEVERPANFLEYLEEEDDTFGEIMATNVKFPVSGNNDQLLSGYSMESGEATGSPFVCDDSCFEDEVVPPDPSRHYDSLIQSKSTRDTLLSTITKAEGGALGVKISGSVAYVSEKSDSSQSISFMIGGYRATETKRIKSPSELKLSAHAKMLLARDPEGFLQTYGNYYVKSVTYGGSFLGSFDLTAESSADSSDLQVEASFKYDKGIYTAEGSTEFTNRQNNTESNLNQTSNYESIPDVRGEVIDEPYDLTERYEQWNDEVEANPAPLYIYLGRWFDSHDVQSVLLDPDNNVDVKTLNLFREPIVITEGTLTVATNERISSTMMMNTIRNMKEWPEVKSNSTLYVEADVLYKEARSYSIAYGLMTDIQLAMLQKEIANHPNDLPSPDDIKNQYGSWLHYEKKLKYRYEDLMESMPERPEPPQDEKYNIYETVTTHIENDNLMSVLLEREDTPLDRSDTTDNDRFTRSFCARSQFSEGMKEYFVGSKGGKPNTLRFRVSSNKNNMIRDGYQQNESFWAYDTQQPDTTEFVIMEIEGHSSAPYTHWSDGFLISPALATHPNIHNRIIDRFWARQVLKYENC